MIELSNVSKHFIQHDGSKLEILNGVNYTFKDSGLYTILGYSGSGKTTLLDIIGGIDDPTSGDIFYNEKKVNEIPSNAKSDYLNEIVSFIFQSNNIIESLNVEENILLSLSARKIKKEEIQEKLSEVLNLLKIENKRYSKVKFLSGGEKQRVAIARALIKGSKIILADEPTGSLDEETSVEIMKTLSEISKDHLVILVTHNVDLAKEYADVILTLKNKNISETFAKNSNSNDIDDTLTTSENQIIRRLSFLNKCKLAFTNFKARKFKTGIIGFALLMIITIISSTCLISDGFSNYLKDINDLSFSKYPISIEPYITNIDLLLNPENNKDHNSNYLDNPFHININEAGTVLTKNNINYKLIEYLEKMDSNYKKNLVYTKNYTLDALVKSYNEDINHVEVGSYSFSERTFNDSINYFNVLPENEKVLNEDYVLIKGRAPQNKNEAILIVGQDHSLSENYITSFGLSSYLNKKDLSVDDFLGLTYKFIPQNKYYTQLAKTKAVDGIFFKREYQLINEGKDLNSLYKLIEENIDILQSLNSSDELTSTPEGVDFLKKLYPYLDKEVVYDLDKINFNDKDQVEELLLSLISHRNLKCYKEKTGESLRRIYEEDNQNKATIVGVYKLDNEKLISSFAPGIYFDSDILNDAYLANHPEWKDVDNDGIYTSKDDKRSYIMRDFESNFFITYDGTFTINTPTILDEIVMKTNDFTSYFNNVKSLGLIDYVSAITYYPSNNSEKEYFINYIDEFNKMATDKSDIITLFDVSGMSFDMTLEIFSIVTKILIIISILIAFISIILVGVILYDFINNEIYNIGIYMSLGIRKSDIRSINALEGIIMSLFASGIGIGLSYLILFSMSNFLKPTLNFFGGFSLMNITPFVFWLIVLISFSLIIILHFLPIFKINKLTIKEILRK